MHLLTDIDVGPDPETLDPERQFADGYVQLGAMMVQMFGVLAVPVGSHQACGLRYRRRQRAVSSHQGHQVITGRRCACAQRDSLVSASVGSSSSGCDAT